MQDAADDAAIGEHDHGKVPHRQEKIRSEGHSLVQVGRGTGELQQRRDFSEEVLILSSFGPLLNGQDVSTLCFSSESGIAHEKSDASLVVAP